MSSRFARAASLRASFLFFFKRSCSCEIEVHVLLFRMNSVEEKKYYKKFKKIRDGFRRYNYNDLLSHALSYLHNLPSSKVERVKKCPWLILLFISWLLKDNKFPNANKFTPDENDFYVIFKAIQDMPGAMRLPSQFDHVSLYFRGVLFQQFIFQEEFRYRFLARQHYFFADLDKNHKLKTNFEEHCGISIEDFLIMSWATITKFVVEDKAVSINAEWYNFSKDGYTKEEIKRFLKLISADASELQKLVNGKVQSSEYYQTSIFMRYPLIRQSGEYTLTEIHQIYRCLEHSVYDILREVCPTEFNKRFGGLFERYMDTGIDYSGIKHTKEKQLKKVLGEHGNQIDFIIHEAEANIFIEAKSVEMSASGQLAFSSEYLKRETKSSVLKAIKQAHDVIKKLDNNAEHNIPTAEQNYLLVVTYKDFLLGSGKDYYEIVAREGMDKIYSDYSSYNAIPPENMFFITLDDFDFICELIKTRTVTIKEILDHVKNADSNPETKKMLFIQHLIAFFGTFKSPKYLEVRMDEAFSSLEKIIRK